MLAAGLAVAREEAASVRRRAMDESMRGRGEWLDDAFIGACSGAMWRCDD